MPNPPNAKDVCIRLWDGAHLGDYLMTLPCGQALKEAGYNVVWSGCPFKFLNLPEGNATLVQPKGPGWTHEQWLDGAIEQFGVSVPRERWNLGFKPSPMYSRHTVICPSAECDRKKADAHTWRRVLKDDPNPLAVVGPLSDHMYCRSLARDLGAMYVKEVDKVSWISWLAGARRVVSLDTGSMHLADACGVDTVGLFMSTSPSTYYPYHSKKIASRRGVFGCLS